MQDVNRKLSPVCFLCLHFLLFALSSLMYRQLSQDHWRNNEDNDLHGKHKWHRMVSDQTDLSYDSKRQGTFWPRLQQSRALGPITASLSRPSCCCSSSCRLCWWTAQISRSDHNNYVVVVFRPSAYTLSHVLGEQRLWKQVNLTIYMITMQIHYSINQHALAWKHRVIPQLLLCMISVFYDIHKLLLLKCTYGHLFTYILVFFLTEKSWKSGI